MPSPLTTIIKAGTKLWLDSVDPELIPPSRALGITGATSNPAIISGLIKSGRYDAELERLISQEGLSDHDAAWALTDQVVAAAQQEFLPVWHETNGDDGYVSFELDPLLEDPDNPMPHDERVAHYIQLGTGWSTAHDNRMIKVPATPAGLDALEELAARGVPLNVTLIFTMRQYQAARDAIWRGAQRLNSLEKFKSVYSIFISRVDVYTADVYGEDKVPELSEDAQGQVGLLNAKLLWKDNQQFWDERPTPLRQEIVFASTGAKLEGDEPWKYVEALVGSDIQTNPPETNDAVEASGKVFERTVDQLPPNAVIEEIEEKVDMPKLEEQLMREGVEKFAKPQQALLKLIAEKRAAIG